MCFLTFAELTKSDPLLSFLFKRIRKSIGMLFLWFVGQISCFAQWNGDREYYVNVSMYNTISINTSSKPVWFLYHYYVVSCMSCTHQVLWWNVFIMLCHLCSPLQKKSIVCILCYWLSSSFHHNTWWVQDMHETT